MKRIISIIMTLSALALLLASCGKESMPWNKNSKAIRVTVTGVADTKASIYTTSTLSSFRIRGYVTDKWREDQVGQSTPEYSAGLYSDPEGGALKDIEVTNSNGWRITGNEDYDNPKYSWVNGKPMLFFSYAPATTATKGTLTIGKSDTSTDVTFPFTYTATANTSSEVPSTNCDDLIFAYAGNTASYESDNTSSNFGKLKSGSSDMISLTFYHALAQIRFCVDPAEFTDIKLISAKLLGPKSNTAGSTGYVGIASNGSCTFTGPSTFSPWTLGTNRYAYIQNFGTNGTTFGSKPTGWTSKEYTSPVARTIYTCEGDVLLVIPQTLTDCGVEVKIQVGTDDPVLLQGKLPATTSSSTNVSWDAGYYYTYKIGTTGTQEDLSLTMTLVDWAERESYIPIN